MAVGGDITCTVTAQKDGVNITTSEASFTANSTGSGSESSLSPNLGQDFTFTYTAGSKSELVTISVYTQGTSDVQSAVVTVTGTR